MNAHTALFNALLARGMSEDLARFTVANMPLHIAEMHLRAEKN